MDPRLHSQPANEIIPRLWLGNAHAAHDETFFRTHQITVVINCTKDIPFAGHAQKQYRIPVDDNLEEEEIRNMALWSHQIAYVILQHYNKGERILVHCMAGMQRSAAAMAMFLIIHAKCHAPEAMQYIRSKRPIAFFPRANFLKSIQYFDDYFHTNIRPLINSRE
jgi:predicted protein tyrosine phosphatase